MTISVRLDSGKIVPVQGVPVFREGARVLVEETASGILRIHRFAFVTYSDQPVS